MTTAAAQGSDLKQGKSIMKHTESINGKLRTAGRQSIPMCGKIDRTNINKGGFQNKTGCKTEYLPKCKPEHQDTLL